MKASRQPIGLRSSGGEDGRQPPVRVEEIIELAIEEFSRLGYKGTNLNNIADQLDITRQALYYYFPRKHYMLLAILNKFLTDLDEVVNIAETKISGPGDRFRIMLRAHFEVVASKPMRAKIFLQEEHNLPDDARDILSKHRKAYQARFVEAFAEGVAAGKFMPYKPELAVSLLIGAGNWVHRWFNLEGPLSAAELAEFADAMLFGGYRMAKRRLR